MNEIIKAELNIIAAMQEFTTQLQHEIDYRHWIGIMQTALLVLILWRVW